MEVNYAMRSKQIMCVNTAENSILLSTTVLPRNTNKPKWRGCVTAMTTDSIMDLLLVITATETLTIAILLEPSVST